MELGVERRAAASPNKVVAGVSELQAALLFLTGLGGEGGGMATGLAFLRSCSWPAVVAGGEQFCNALTSTSMGCWLRAQRPVLELGFWASYFWASYPCCQLVAAPAVPLLPLYCRGGEVSKRFFPESGVMVVLGQGRIFSSVWSLFMPALLPLELCSAAPLFGIDVDKIWPMHPCSTHPLGQDAR
jgi:hypothetical protein